MPVGVLPQSMAKAACASGMERAPLLGEDRAVDVEEVRVLLNDGVDGGERRDGGDQLVEFGGRIEAHPVDQFRFVTLEVGGSGIGQERLVVGR